MTVEKKLFASNNELYVKPTERIDVNTVVELENEVNAHINNIQYLTLDFSNVHYISSIGLRTIMLFQKKIGTKGKMTITNVKPEIMEIFKIAGFDNFLNII